MVRREAVETRNIGRYRLERRIGGGGMGEVWKAEDLRLKRTVALKFLPEGLSQDPCALARFEREARAVSSLSHPNICTVHDVGEQDGRTFLVMEYCEGGELFTYWKEKKRVTEDEAREIMSQLLSAISFCHSNHIVHRDLKFQNILLAR